MFSQGLVWIPLKPSIRLSTAWGEYHKLAPRNSIIDSVFFFFFFSSRFGWTRSPLKKLEKKKKEKEKLKSLTYLCTERGWVIQCISFEIITVFNSPGFDSLSRPIMKCFWQRLSSVARFIILVRTQSLFFQCVLIKKKTRHRDANYGLCQLITLELYLNFSLMMANVKGI